MQVITKEKLVEWGYPEEIAEEMCRVDFGEEFEEEGE